jgi:hypothetical protein
LFVFLQGEAETRILEYAQCSNGAVEACIAKPGLINGPDKPATLVSQVLTSVIGLPSIRVGEIAAALLDQVVDGFEKDTLRNEDLVRIGQQVPAGQKE